MGTYRGLITGACLMGQDRVTNLLERNLQQEEEAARIAERSAEELLRKAQHAEEQED
jgi:ferritin-like metal-binding protein YciE